MLELQHNPKDENPWFLMINLEVGDEVAYVEWESKYMECWEYGLWGGLKLLEEGFIVMGPF